MWKHFELTDQGKPYALVRADHGVVERWVPETREWVPAPLNAAQVYGYADAGTAARAISRTEAEALQRSGEG